VNTLLLVVLILLVLDISVRQVGTLASYIKCRIALRIWQWQHRNDA